jgi:DNA segregation ATPase FtsK/SpoIIIE, S-DNA-T family
VQATYQTNNGRMKEKIKNVLQQFKIKADVFSCEREGSFLLCDIILQPGGTVKQIEKRSMEFALAINAISDPIVYPIPKKGIIRLEFMINDLQTICFDEVINSQDFINSKHIVPIAIGVSRNGQKIVADLTKMPHLLVAGTTGSGKSMILHSIINSVLIGCADNVKLVLIDPKKIEFSNYSNSSCLLYPIAQNIETSINLFSKLVDDMENRFAILQKAKCRDITQYKKKMPRIVVIVDEFSDLMMASKKTVQELVCRLAQKSRACGIHLIVSTQRPSANVITGIIKANFSARISCKVGSIVDSRVILDRSGAEKLFGNGDSIIDCQEYPFTRFKGSFLSEENIVKNIKNSSRSWLYKIFT